jgi:hypothetical protein
MSTKFTLDQLTEGIRQRHLGAQNRQLVSKWSRTGLLRGLSGQTRENMATMLENQAAQVLREQSSISTGAGSTVSSGDLRGFQNVAFPIVRRVFGGLVANELVSVQPMSLPSGLLFYLDYTYGTAVGGGTFGGSQYTSGSSIYGSPAGKGIQSGSQAIGGQYNLAGSGYSRVYNQKAVVATDILASGSFQGNATFSTMSTAALTAPMVATGSDARLLMFDPQVITAIEAEGGMAGERQSGASYYAVFVSTKALSGSTSVTTSMRDGSNNYYDSSLVKNIALVAAGDEAPTTGPRVISSDVQTGTGILNIRRLNELGTWDGAKFTANAMIGQTATNACVKMIISGSTGAAANGVDVSTTAGIAWTNAAVSFPIADQLSAGTDGDALTIPAFESNFGTTPSPEIPEIDIKVQSIAVTAQTRKLRARWSPELAQDLNAYHSLDAEVELTQILSEQIALELDREILNDLVMQADTRFYWSRQPGNFVNKRTAVPVSANFTGTVREWYETLIETIIDVGNEIHRKTLRGSANFIVVSPEVATILEASVMYRPSYSLDAEGQVGTPFTIGAEKVGTLSNRFTVYKDPYFPRNQILVGYKGGSYLETGYVYAPYVPLIVTPTIFAPEDFTPRKGVMTRYGKKMVRSDFYGTITVTKMDVI